MQSFFKSHKKVLFCGCSTFSPPKAGWLPPPPTGAPSLLQGRAEVVTRFYLFSRYSPKESVGGGGNPESLKNIISRTNPVTRSSERKRKNPEFFWAAAFFDVAAVICRPPGLISKRRGPLTFLSGKDEAPRKKEGFCPNTRPTAATSKKRKKARLRTGERTGTSLHFLPLSPIFGALSWEERKRICLNSPSPPKGPVKKLLECVCVLWDAN